MTLTRSPEASKSKRPGGPGRQRTVALLLGLAVLGLVLGGVAYLTLGSSDDGLPLGTQTGAPSASSRGAGASGTAGASGSPDASTSTTAAGGRAGRDPFGGRAGGAAPTGATGTGNTAATGTPTTGTTSAPTSGTTQPNGNAIVTVTATRTVATTATVTRSVPTTVTVTSGTLYLGLYGWTGSDQPIFRVNDQSATPSPGDTFGSSLVYVGSNTDGGETCATVTYLGTPRALCPGDVLKLV